MSHQVQSPVGEEGATDRSDTSSNNAGGARQNQSLLGAPASASTSESNANPNKPEKRAWSAQSLLKNDLTDQYHDVVTNQQIIELIARKEALYHVEMAWRAQQRLVRRCLGLRLLGDLQSAGTRDSFGIPTGKGRDAAEPEDK